ncbi:MAG TPA: hypothetical protein VFV41_19305 [Streptosporangiaceae bacterium]|nr:hypothetical protein [Streptosporangiaceae bacterium]
MDEGRARRVSDGLRDRGIDAHLAKLSMDRYAVRVRIDGGREAIWGAEGTASLEASVMRNGNLVGFVPTIPGSAGFDDTQVVDVIARADYSDPVGRQRATAPPPAPALPREGGVFRRFLEGFRY